jgi:hypothetical protein
MEIRLVIHYKKIKEMLLIILLKIIKIKLSLSSKNIVRKKKKCWKDMIIKFRKLKHYFNIKLNYNAVT